MTEFLLPLNHKQKNYLLSLSFETNEIPKMTTMVPNICTDVNLSSKKTNANTIVEIGPIPATTAKFDELMSFMEMETKNDGITVAKTAINKPNA